MRAIQCTGYGPPERLELRQVPRPLPKPGQLLVRVHAATVTQGDCEVRASRFADWVWLPARLAIGILRPRQPVLGMEIAGVVEAIGGDASRFEVGDRIFGSTGFGMGAHADYAVVSEKAAVTHIPAALSYAEAAGIPTGGLNGLHFVRACGLRRGESVLINGAGGSIGMFTIQLAKAAGAEITGVDRASKREMMRELGADHVIDYRQTDFWSHDRKYDVVIDVVGTSPFAPTVATLKDGGRYVLGNPRSGQMLRAIVENRRGRVKVLFGLAGEEVADLDQLKQQVADGVLQTVIDRSLPLEATAEAHRYVESGEKSGIVVIDVSGEAMSRP